MTNKEAIERYHWIKKVVYRSLGPSVDRDNIVGEIFLWFMSSGKVMSGKMIYWRMLDWIRKYKGTVTLAPEVIEGMVPVEDDLAVAKERQGFLSGLIKKADLGNEALALIYTRFYLGMEVEDMAKAEGVGVEVVRRELSRIMDALKETADDSETGA